MAFCVFFICHCEERGNQELIPAVRYIFFWLAAAIKRMPLPSGLGLYRY
jgi:hypothetical protein